MKKIIIALLPIFIFASLSYEGVCANYDSDLLNYGIQFAQPENWIRGKENNPPVIYFKHPQGVVLIMISLPHSTDSISFQISLILYRNSTKPTNEEKITLCGETCYVFDIDQTTTNGARLKTRDYQFLKKGKLYGIKYTARMEYFDRYLPEFENALNSFKIIE